MSLHALAYCERLFYLEEVEEIRIADASVYAGRALHEELKDEEEQDGEWTNREMTSESLGLTGKVDCLKRRDGSLIPYEHKRGRVRREDGRASAWPTDALQVSAYGMLLEDETGREVSEGRIRYHADNVTVRVPLDQEARKIVLDTVERAKALRKMDQRPPITNNDRSCVRCSLAPVCLPEEERLINDPNWEPLRLFPADREQKTIHIVEQGAHISRSGDTLKVEAPDGEVHVFPVREVGAIVLHGHPQISTQALHFCVENEIGVHWLSAGQRYIAGIAPGAGAVHRKLRQYQALSDSETRLRLARKLTMAKIEGGLRYLLRATRGFDRDENLIGKLNVIRKALRMASQSSVIDELRGYEGIAGRAYFEALPAILRKEVPDELRFSGRSRRPPKDRFNALLGFGYSLLYQAVMQAVITVGLEPAIGFYHTPRSSAHPLVLDIMELFRMQVWDIILVGSLNRLQWDQAEDFEITGIRVWLSNSGRRKAIKLFEERLQESWKHPVVEYSLSYSRLIELEVRLLEKEWSGSPGLFARMRLR